MTIAMPVRTRRLVVLLSVTLAAAGSMAATASHAVAQTRQQHVRVTVMGRGDTPVRDLTIADFIVREDNVVREVVNVTPATRSDVVVVMIDDSQAMAPFVTDLREGVQTFIRTLMDVPSPPTVRLATFGDRPTVLVDFTTSVGTLTAAAGRIVPRPGAGSTLLDALVETTRDLRTRDTSGATIVAFVSENGPEFSNASRERVSDAIKERGASLWSIVLADPSGPEMSGPGRERASVIGGVTADSGGLNRLVLGRQGIVPGFAAIADALTAGYDITYGRPDRLIPPSKLEVDTRDAALKVLVSRWAAP